MLFKGLLHLLEMLEQADVVGEFGRALGDAGQGGEDGCPDTGKQEAYPIFSAIF